MNGIKIGYARVSTGDQSLDVQIGQLEQIGCTKIFSEKKSGKSVEGREQLDACLKYAREGDTIIVCRLDRFARSMKDFCDLVRTMKEKGIGFRCLNPDLDTTGAVGELTLHVLMAVAQFELSLRSERQREGIDKAMERGVYRKSATAKSNRLRKKIIETHEKYPDWTMAEIAKFCSCATRTIYRLAPEVKKGDVPETLRKYQERRRAGTLAPTTP